MGPAGFVLAATASGVGKTTVAAGIIRALSDAGHRVQPFKTGPDYIDPTYLTLAAGRLCRNLDGYLTGDILPWLYGQVCSSSGADMAVVEGVMGLYDGLGSQGLYSTAWLAERLGLPIILIVDAAASSTSVAAVVHGFATLPQASPRLLGVIANRVGGERHAELVAAALRHYTDVPLLGWLPKLPAANFQSRSLGLIPAGEEKSTEEKVALTAAAVKEHIDLERLVGLACAPSASVTAPLIPAAVYDRRVAVACDRAFNFQYEDNLELLRSLGAEITCTSPLQDRSLPEADLLILPGGSIGVFAEELVENREYMNSVREHVKRGGRIYAESGGMVYLTRSYRASAESASTSTFVGLIDAETVMAERLQRFGYVRARALRDNLLLQKDWEIPAHEFHYTRLVEGESGDALSVKKAFGDSDEWLEGFSTPTLFATHLHMNFYSRPEVAARLLR